MRELNPTLRELAKRCQTILDSVRSTSTACNEASTRTQIEYIKQAKQLLARAKQLEGGLYRAVQATTSISTFRKRLAALGGSVPDMPDVPRRGSEADAEGSR